MQSWIIDDSGEREALIERLEALTHDSFVSSAKKRLDEIQKSNAYARQHNRAGDQDEEALAQHHLDLLRAPDDAEAFDRFKGYALEELRSMETTHAGVCVRYMANPREAPGGRTLSFSISEFETA